MLLNFDVNLLVTIMSFSVVIGLNNREVRQAVERISEYWSHSKREIEGLLGLAINSANKIPIAQKDPDTIPAPPDYVMEFMQKIMDELTAIKADLQRTNQRISVLEDRINQHMPN